jgi:hypothetical protein
MLYLQRIFHHSKLLASILCGRDIQFMGVLVSEGRQKKRKPEKKRRFYTTEHSLLKERKKGERCGER